MGIFETAIAPKPSKFPKVLIWHFFRLYMVVKTAYSNLGEFAGFRRNSSICMDNPRFLVVKRQFYLTFQVNSEKVDFGKTLAGAYVSDRFQSYNSIFYSILIPNFWQEFDPISRFSISTLAQPQCVARFASQFCSPVLLASLARHFCSQFF